MNWMERLGGREPSSWILGKTLHGSCLCEVLNIFSRSPKVLMEASSLFDTSCLKALSKEDRIFALISAPPKLASLQAGPFPTDGRCSAAIFCKTSSGVTSSSDVSLEFCGSSLVLDSTGELLIRPSSPPSHPLAHLTLNPALRGLKKTTDIETREDHVCRQPASMAGYAVDTIDPAKAGLHCCECGLILKEAVQTSEGQRMCKECYDSIKELPDYTSKKTGISILDEDGKPFCYPDNAVRREVKKLVVICSNKKFGCDFIGELEKYFKQHIQDCKFQPVDCPNREKGCLEKIAPSELKRHVSEECQFRVIECQYCQQDTENHLLKEHYEICMKFPLECKLCSQSIQRDQMAIHQEKDCPKVLCVCGKILTREGDDEGSFSTHLKHPAAIMTHIMSVMTYSKSIVDTLKIIENRVIKLEAAASRPASPKHVQMSEETSMVIKNLQDRLSPLEVLHKTMTASSAKAEKNIEVLQRMLRDMEAKSKQQEAQIIALKAQIEQRNVASSWESGRISSRSNNSSDTTRVMMVEKKYEDLERQVASLKVHVSELELQLQASLASTHNGTFLWRIPEVARRKRDAIEERVTSIYSPPFYTGRNGYKICVRAYLNGDGIGYNTHLSLFFVLMKGEFDPLLKWPFDHKVSLILVDQNHRKHIVQTFRPTTESSSFQRPISDMNVASGCPQFAKLTVLEDENYTKDDVIFIKCLIDTSKIFHP